MNHKVRARSAVERSIPKPVMLKLIGNGWFDEIVKAVARALKECERDARRIAIREAANAVGRISGRGRAFDAVLALDKRPRR